MSVNRIVVAMLIRRKLLAATSVATVLALGACSGGRETSGVSSSTEESTDTVVDPSEREPEPTGTSGLAIAADAIIQVQSSKYEDYEIDGSNVRLAVREGVELTGSECVIIDSATGSDHPDATFVLVETDGTETVC